MNNKDNKVNKDDHYKIQLHVLSNNDGPVSNTKSNTVKINDNNKLNNNELDTVIDEKVTFDIDLQDFNCLNTINKGIYFSMFIFMLQLQNKKIKKKKKYRKRSK